MDFAIVKHEINQIFGLIRAFPALEHVFMRFHMAHVLVPFDVGLTVATNQKWAAIVSVRLGDFFLIFVPKLMMNVDLVVRFENRVTMSTLALLMHFNFQ